jgi:hypothetical protein
MTSDDATPMDETTESEWTPSPEPEPMEPLRPLVEEARWTSSPAAEKLLLASQAFYADWSPLHANAPYAVYHYTDAAALKGILETGRLWAADMLYLDGSREVNYTYGLIRDHLHRRLTPSQRSVADFVLQAESALDPRRWARGLFVACFCEDGDALSQWRAHAGDGYSLGLRTAALDGVGVRVQSAGLRRVVYDAEQQSAQLQRLLDRALAVISAATSAPEEERRAINDTVLEFLIDHMIEFVATFKPPTFREEAEWRLAVALDTGYVGEGTYQVQFRVEAGHPVPYVELDISPRGGPSDSPVAEVVCGPIDRGELAARSIRLLLKSRGNSSARVRSSALTLAG